MPQKTEQLQVLSKPQEQTIGELTKQLAMLNNAFEKGLISQSKFKQESQKIRQKLSDMQKQ